MSTEPQITLYTTMSPNGHKISMTLEELGLKYKAVPMNLRAIQHKEPWYLAINPNGRLPALTDTLPDGTSISLFESASIQQYLIDRYDTENKISYPRGTKQFYETNNWLFWQMAGLGPMQGQVNHFFRYLLSTEPEEYSKNRYYNESRRLYRVLDKHLADHGSQEYLVGDKCTIADIAIFAWANFMEFATLNIDEWPHVKAWRERVAKRPAVQRGQDVPTKFDLERVANDPEAFNAYIANHLAWIRQTTEADARA